MAKKKPPKKDVQAVVDENLIRDSAEVQCSDAEIAELCGVSLEELMETFGPFIERHRALGRKKIRVALYNKAISDVGINNSVAIWLSKQYLGMKEPEKIDEDEHLDGVEVVDYAKAK